MRINFCYMKKSLVLLVFTLALSCKEKEKKVFFIQIKPSFKIRSFKTFVELIDSLENLKSLNKGAVFKLKKEDTEYSFVASTFFSSKPLFHPLRKLS